MSTTNNAAQEAIVVKLKKYIDSKMESIDPYQLAIAQGYTGTSEDFYADLASLEGLADEMAGL